MSEAASLVIVGVARSIQACLIETYLVGFGAFAAASSAAAAATMMSADPVLTGRFLFLNGPFSDLYGAFF